MATEPPRNLADMRQDWVLQALSNLWLRETTRYRYTYNFTWMGVPVIQLPQDLLAIQELIWRVGPDLVVETGIAHGGGLVFYASILELLGGDGLAVGIDIDIRAHNRAALERHPMARRIAMIEGSSTDDAVMAKVRELTRGRSGVMVILDSNHTHEHVLSELRLYSPLVTRGSYLIVLDTAIEDLPPDLWANRPWGKGNNPKTAVREFLESTDRFVVDRDVEDKLLITVAPQGYLRCVKDR